MLTRTKLNLSYLVIAEELVLVHVAELRDVLLAVQVVLVVFLVAVGGDGDVGACGCFVVLAVPIVTHPLGENVLVLWSQTVVVGMLRRQRCGGKSGWGSRTGRLNLRLVGRRGRTRPRG